MLLIFNEKTKHILGENTYLQIIHLIKDLYPEFLKLSSKKTTQFFRREEDLNNHFTKENT